MLQNQEIAYRVMDVRTEVQAQFYFTISPRPDSERIQAFLDLFHKEFGGYPYPCCWMISKGKIKKGGGIKFCLDVLDKDQVRVTEFVNETDSYFRNKKV